MESSAACSNGAFGRTSFIHWGCPFLTTSAYLPKPRGERRNGGFRGSRHGCRLASRQQAGDKPTRWQNTKRSLSCEGVGYCRNGQSPRSNREATQHSSKTRLPLTTSKANGEPPRQSQPWEL